MNTRQRRILIAVVAVIGVMLLFPPFYLPRSSVNDYGTTTYKWLVADNNWGRVDLGLLFTQFFVVGIIGLVAYVLSDDRMRARPGKDSDRVKGPGPAPAASESVRTKRRELGYGDDPPPG